ncbi:glycosyltransferase family 2 protein [Rasiella rasia]|uniref:Glycosyltransferase family 2 protein n=1 Tax=Rasiella rasia TaxID=2744027 RepID=A0A6G6GP58_9FLAO|nr:glycosyltransferase family A protein [Rasiella rasia]QIE60339.1 glycosyltransferase family 2 protein [Rasiella rasia]
MSIVLVIPTYNEAAHLGDLLRSIVSQTLKPKKVVIVNDGSTDSTQEIIDSFTAKYSFMISVGASSTSEHAPGSKVVDAFYRGFSAIKEEYAFIGKFDADIILPPNYFEKIISLFNENRKIGIAGGNLYIQSDDAWVFENISEKTKVRGPIKLYRKECFEAIGGLKRSIGWDTVDELLAQYHGWLIKTDQSLHVKHLKPTGATYTEASKYKQGEAFYKMRYGWALTQVAAMKLAQRKSSIAFYYNCMRGYLKAKKSGIPYLVNKEEGAFIRQLRWKNIKKKIF